MSSAGSCLLATIWSLCYAAWMRSFDVCLPHFRLVSAARNSRHCFGESIVMADVDATSGSPVDVVSSLGSTMPY